MRPPVLFLVVLLVSSGCGLFDDNGPEETAQAFLSALARGKHEQAAKLTDAPKAAQAALDQAREALAPEAVSAKLDGIDERGDASTAKFTVTWKLPHDRKWTYPAQAELLPADNAEAGWQVRWTPSVLHPKLAAQQTLGIQADTPELAPVLDRDGAKLLEPRQVVSILLYPQEAKNLSSVARSLAAQLRRFDPTITAKSIVDGAGKVKGKDGAHLVAVLRDGDYLSVKGAIYDLPGVKFSRQERLLAPEKNFGSQVLPAVRTMVEDKVAGAAGWRVIARDASGAEVAELHTVKARPSTAIRTTLSHRTQKAAERAVDGVRKQAAIVAIQPSTGDILAVAQNKAADKDGAISLTGRYPPGSTFKIATALAALTTGQVTSRSKVNCPGTTVIGGRLVPNESRFALGKVPLDRAFARSCNTTFARLAARMPSDALTNAARDLGIGADFVIPGITTITGSAPAAGNLVQRAENGFGQGKVLASPFGMALAAATVQSGKTPTPALLDGEPTKASDLGNPLPAGTAKALRAMMRKVVTEGTATRLAGMGAVHGKTGTAQFGDGKHSHGWFAGYRGDLAFATLIVSGESSKPAVDVTRVFLSGLG